MRVKKSILLLILLQTCLAFSKNSMIILYGCSSAGKTSIATELLRTLPGEWKYIPGNRFPVVDRNRLLWKYINETMSSGHNVIIDTHDLQFLIDNPENIHVVIALVYCSPEKLIEHVGKRNTTDNAKNHRKLKFVFAEYCAKYKSVKKDQGYIDILHKDRLKNNYGFFVAFALKTIRNKFFVTNEQTVAYIAPMLQNYDCFINTGKTSIIDSAAKIKQELMLRLES